MTIRVIQNHLRLPILLVAAAEFAVFFVAPYVAVWAGPAWWSYSTGSAPGPIWPRALLFAVAAIICFAATGLYDVRQRSAFSGVAVRVAAAVLAVMAVTAVAFYLFHELALSRGLWWASMALAAVGSLVIRLVYGRLADRDALKKRVLVFGSGRRAAAVAQLRRRVDRRGFALVGYVAAAGDEAGRVPARDLLSGGEPLPELCQRLKVDEVVVAMDDRRRQFPMVDLLQCRIDGLEVTDVVTFLERETGKVKLDVLNPSWIIFSEGFGRGPINDFLERGLDILASLLLLLLAWPVMLLTAVAIKLEGGWRAPVLYRQSRVGQYGRPFELLKFRSMREDAESDGEARWAQKNDDRVTRVGALIRKVRIDELPQVFNVLRGDMSFVGPRPERPEFVVQLEEKIPFYRERHIVKPGITGWAQLCYPYGSSDQDAVEKLQYDLYYVKNHSLLFYLVVLLLTVEVIVWSKGAR